MLRRLLIVSHVPHYKHEGVLYAYGPYTREIDIWAGLFPELLIAAPLRREAPPGDSLPFKAVNVSIAPQLETGGNQLGSKFLQMLFLPGHVWRLARAMRTVDAIHVRCPGNLGLLGCILAPLYRKPRVAKYAGQWADHTKESTTWRWQKAVLRSKFWGGPVLVYGSTSEQSSHIVSFFTSVMDAGQMTRAVQVAKSRHLESFKRVLFVGRLTAERNVHTLLQAIHLCRNQGVNFSCRIVGDGEMRNFLAEETARLRLSHVISFAGALRFEEVMDEYSNADILVLVAESEGWGKALVEAMAFGLVCIGGNCGPVPWILGEGRGKVVSPRDVRALARTLIEIERNPHHSAEMARLSAIWAQKYSLEGLQNAIRSVLESSWGVSLDLRSPESRFFPSK